MGLFSKLFSREGEDLTEAEGRDAQAAVPGGEDGVTKSEESAASGGGGGAKDSRAREAATDKAASPPSAASDKQAQRAREAATAQPAGSPKRAGPPPLEPRIPDANRGGKRPAEVDKRDAASPARPPAAAGTALAPAKLPVAAGAAPASPAWDADARTDAQRGPTAPAARRGIAPMRSPTDTAVKGKAPSSQSQPEQPAVQVPARSALGPAAALPLDAAVDAAVAALMDHGAARPGAEETHHHHLADQRAVAETFSDMAKVHAHPLRELMFHLSVGRTPRQWATACRPVLRPLFDAATQIGLLELVGALGVFDAALERATAESTAYISAATAEALTAAYERLRQQLPDAFTPPDRADNRRLILLESLLLQIPTLQRRTLSKLYSAGLSSLGQLGQARPEELSAVAGIDRALAQAVVDHIQRFELERSRINPTAWRSHLPDRLRAIVARLEQLQAEFERADQDDSAARKRTVRNSREAAVLELDVAFAEVGEVDLIEELKRCPVRGKIERVASYLEQLQSSM